MLDRPRAMRQLETTLAENPVCALLGPRQCGKSTLAAMFAERRESIWFDLETAEGQSALREPELALKSLHGLVVIDEVQRRPELFAALRPLADRRDSPAKFLILGSASTELVRGVSESLAGRVGFVDLGGFDLGETGSERLDQLWLRGGFPRSFTAPNDASSGRWRTNFIRTFLERDLPQLGIRTPVETLRRFWTMVAHFHGQTWNAAELARSLNASENTARHYLDVLCGAYVARRLMPWHTNVGKRELKAPKVYVRDSGLLHSLLGIKKRTDLLGHPKLGASWEGFALEQVLSLYGASDAWYWGTHAGAELDLLLFRHGKAWGFEFKVGDGPGMTKSLHAAIENLNLTRGWIIHPGTKRYAVHDKIEALPLRDLDSLMTILGEPE